jgi:hypothetical protein
MNYNTGARRADKKRRSLCSIAVMAQVSERIHSWLIEIDNFVNVRPNRSAEMFAQQQTERLLPCAARLSHALK